MIVADASLVVDLLVQADLPDRVRERVQDESLHAPALLDFEVTSSLRGLVLGGLITRRRAGAALSDLTDLPLRRWAWTHLGAARGLDLRHNMTAYDAAYAALAEALDCPLWTRDAGLAHSTGHRARIELV